MQKFSLVLARRLHQYENRETATKIEHGQGDCMSAKKSDGHGRRIGAALRPAEVEDLAPASYNFDHFQSRHLLADAQRTLSAQGVQPGEAAPDFELPRVGGGSQRLSFLLGKPILLHFGSYT